MPIYSPVSSSGSESAAPPAAGSRRFVSVAAGSAIVIGLLALAIIFANAHSARLVAENARMLHWTNATLGAAGIARASIGQAVFFALDHEMGVASDQARQAALDEAHSNLAHLETTASEADAVFGEPRPEIVGPITTLLELGNETVALLEQDQPVAAAELFAGAYEGAHQSTSSVLTAEQDLISARIDDTEALAGRVGALTRFAVTLLIPAAALLVYRRIVQRQVRERQAQMEAKLQAERELGRAKDAFIAGLSHELRTPLTSIYGFSELLIEDGLVDPDMSMELIGLINHESAELSRMVDDLLTAARLDADALSYDLGPVAFADQLEAVVGPMTRSGAEITVTCPDTTVTADELRLRQVMRNLLSNAVRHGGPVIRVEAEELDGALVCRVIDNGAGVPSDFEDRLFERFIHDGREALLAGSVGLGLAIARSLTEAMEGSLSYERIQDETHFVLTLPLAPKETRQEGLSETSETAESVLTMAVAVAPAPVEIAPTTADPPSPPTAPAAVPMEVTADQIATAPADPWELAEV